MTMSSGTFTVNGVNLSAGSSPAPQGAPQSLIATRAVELKDGWAGQVIVAGEVVLEDPAWESARDAEEWATRIVADRIKALFTAPATENDDEKGDA